MSVINSNALLMGSDGYTISRSVRLRSSASAYFNRTPASATNRKTWTWSAWAKLGTLAGTVLFGAGDGTTSNRIQFYFDANNCLRLLSITGGVNTDYRISTSVYRDPSAWYHVVLVFDTTQATASNRVKMYVNGVQLTSFSTSNDPSLNLDSYVNNNIEHRIGNVFGTNYLDGYMAEVYFVDGQALTPSSFGENDAITGVWKPKKYGGTYGTNGFYLNFSDNSNNTAATIGKDYSGNGNNWTPNNISVTTGITYDSMTDVPTVSAVSSNYAVLNPLDIGQTSTLTNGNLTFTTSSTTNYSVNRGNIGMSSGKWYWEITMTSAAAANGVGIAKSAASLNTYLGANTNGYGWQGSNGNVYYNGTGTSYNGGATFTNNDVIGVALDMDAGTLTFYKNGTSQGTAASSLTGEWFPAVSDMSSSTTASMAANFGQRPFNSTPPSGYKALNTFNLSEPTIKNGNAYFDGTTYTGTGSSLSITNTASMQPDLVWVKGRSGATDHALYDAVRGVQLDLASNTTAAETTQSTGLTAFNSNGFTVGSLAKVNTSSATYVGWQWKKGATPGFDIVTFTGTGGVQNISHSLGVAPKMMIFKSRNNVSGWSVYHASIGNTGALNMQATTATSTSIDWWNNTSPTSSQFTIGANINISTWTWVAYLFAEVAGFSKFGSYTGNGSTDGPFVYCGFRPRWVLLKQSSGAGSWTLWDTARNAYNQSSTILYPHLSNAETTGVNIDVLSNGFKLRHIGDINASSTTVIFAAFAENPFKYSLAR